MGLIKKIIGLLVLAALGFAGFYFFSQTGNDRPDGMEKPPVLVSVAPVTPGDIAIDLDAVGTAMAYQTVSIRSRIDSQMMEVKFKDGDYVEEGALLFVLDDRALQAQLKQQQANLVRDRAQMDNLRRQLERKKTLSQKGYETTSNLDDAQAEYEVQAANVKATQAAIDNLKVQLEYTQIRAPISGRTGTIRLTVGNNIKANDADPLVTINQVKPILVQMSLPQRYFGQMRAAMVSGVVEVTARHEGNGNMVKGRAEYIDNAVDETTGTFVARASFPNEDEVLWPGMFTKVTVRLGIEKGALTVPEVAIQQGQEGEYVFVIHADKAEKRPVKIARLQEGRAVISEGLQPGEQVVVDGLLKLEEGSAIRITGTAP